MAITDTVVKDTTMVRDMVVKIGSSS